MVNLHSKRKFCVLSASSTPFPKRFKPFVSWKRQNHIIRNVKKPKSQTPVEIFQKENTFFEWCTSIRNTSFKIPDETLRGLSCTYNFSADYCEQGNDYDYDIGDFNDADNHATASHLVILRIQNFWLYSNVL